MVEPIRHMRVLVLQKTLSLLLLSVLIVREVHSMLNSLLQRHFRILLHFSSNTTVFLQSARGKRGKTSHPVENINSSNCHSRQFSLFSLSRLHISKLFRSKIRFLDLFVFARSLLFPFTLTPSLDVCFGIKLFLHAFGCHRPYESIVCFFRWERAIVFTKTPSNSCISIWTAAINRISIIQTYSYLIRFSPIVKPSKQLFPPIHSHIAMNFSRFYELFLCSIPERVVCFSLSEIVESVFI